MTECHIVTDPELPGVTRISRDASLPRPRIGLFGGIHGNERCGVEVIRRLEAAMRDGSLAPLEGTIVLVHGNPDASFEGRRYTRGGADLNRLFDYDFEVEIPAERWSPEHRRAHMLKPILEEIDVLLDIHSATWPTPPFVIVNDLSESSELARRLGFDWVTCGWNKPGNLMDKVTIGIMQRLGRAAVSVECGQHDDPETVDAAWACALRYLRATGAIEGEAPTGDPTMLEVVEIVSRPSLGFKFVKAIRGLDRLEAGEVVAADQISELRVREPCFVLMPNDTTPVGRDMLFLAREA